jgi:ubiquitin C-terminal hydrolase
MQESKKREAEPTISHQRILAAYQDVNRSLWSAHLPCYVRPLGFLHEIREAVRGTVYESFGMPVPNDAHEYLVYLLDQFHEALNKPAEALNNPMQPSNPSFNPTMHERAATAWSEFRTRHHSPVVDLFFGMMRKAVTCGGCGNVSYRWETFNVLKVPCKGATFADWIHAETNDRSTIDGYACDACHARHPATLQSALWSLPTNLFVTLHRFEYDGRKNMTPCPYEGAPLTFTFAEESPQASAVYELRGVVDHHGNHRGGHYTAQWKHPFSQEWWWMDDEKARAMGSPQFSPSNYMFFFKAVGVPAAT